MADHTAGRFTVGAFGMLTWDQIALVDSFPEAGSYRVVRRSVEQSGGTTGNIAVALARLGVDVSLAARVGDDHYGRNLLDDLRHEGCDVRYVPARAGASTDRGLIIVSGTGADSERTILWFQGARLQHGDHLPIEEFFARDLVIVDTDDARLRLLLLDLPMHVSPRTRILGTMTFLAEHPPHQALELALRHDYLAGNENELRHLTSKKTLEEAIERFQKEMVLSQVRFAAISTGSSGCVLVSRDETMRLPAYEVPSVDPTGAGDAFAAGIAFGILNRWGLMETGRFANAMGALATRGLGARSSLPDLQEVKRLRNDAEVKSNYAGNHEGH